MRREAIACPEMKELRQKMTTGHPALAILHLTLPMLVSSLLQNAQSLIDLFWIGSLGHTHVAALAISGTVMMMLFPLIIGMSVGTVAVVSRRVGEMDLPGASHAAGQALGLALLLGLVAGGAGIPFAESLSSTLGADAETAALAASYLRIQFAGSFTLFFMFVGGHAVFRACGNSVIPMALMLMANLVNMLLDPVLIFGLFGFPAMGIKGAALATVMAQTMAAVTGLVLLVRGHAGIRFHLSHILPRPAVALRILKIGLPGTGQMLARSLMVLALIRIVAESGTAAVAAFGIGHRFQMLILMPAFAFGNAAATLVGQNMGAGNPERAARGAWIAVWMDFLIMAFGGLLLALFAPVMVRAFSDEPEVVAMGSAFLRITCGFYVFAGLSIVLGRALQGAGDTLTPMLLTIVSLWGLQLPLAYGLSRMTVPPTHGVWWAIAIAVTFHGLVVAFAFRQGKWKRQKA